MTGLVVMVDDPGMVNAAGNPVHFLGISWAGGYGERVSEHAVPRDVASVSGALFAVRRRVWERLGGLDPAYFLYHEDADLSLRVHLTGLRVVYCPRRWPATPTRSARTPRSSTCSSATGSSPC